MAIASNLLQNYMLICAFTAYFLAQATKIIVILYKEKRLDLSLLFASGGMPSSHASTVTALSVSCARIYGLASSAFAITFVLAAVVMYDATGVRRAAGEHAKILNQLRLEHGSRRHELLKELIGHTPLQVIVGSLLGFVVPFLIPIP